ncbi:MAG: TrmH family RNA methyltransferase [Planctomycetota bacterium]
MDTIPILDVDDPRVASYHSLRERELRSLAGARDAGLFVAEGKLVLERLIASSHAVSSVFLHEHRFDELAPLLAKLPASTPIYLAPADVHERISGVRFHQGVLALGESGPPLAFARTIADATRVVVLEGIVNHDNLGGVFRNIAAFAGERGAVLLDPRCADPLYRRSIRTSMGWVLQIPFARIEPWPTALDELVRAGFSLFALTPQRDATPIDDAVPLAGPRVALLLGAEGPGLSESALRAAPMRVRIPIDDRVDSLNLATAAAIALHRFAS